MEQEVPHQPPQQQISSPYLGINQHQEFQENVMHILDRSHQRYRMKIDNNFIVDSEKAKQVQQAVSRNSSTSDREDASNSSLGRIRVAGHRGSRLLLERVRQASARSDRQVKEVKLPPNKTTARDSTPLVTKGTKLGKTQIGSKR